MFKKLSLVALLIAWLCANGALLDTVQVVAWAKMFAGYAQTMPVQAALRATFDPAKPCEMCIGVAAAKIDLAEKHLPVTPERTGEKLVLALHVAAPIVLNQPAAEWPSSAAVAGPIRTEHVPVPPPRA